MILNLFSHYCLRICGVFDFQVEQSFAISMTLLVCGDEEFQKSLKRSLSPCLRAICCWRSFIYSTKVCITENHFSFRFLPLAPPLKCFIHVLGANREGEISQRKGADPSVVSRRSQRTRCKFISSRRPGAPWWIAGIRRTAGSLCKN